MSKFKVGDILYRKRFIGGLGSDIIIKIIDKNDKYYRIQFIETEFEKHHYYDYRINYIEDFYELTKESEFKNKLDTLVNE